MTLTDTLLALVVMVIWGVNFVAVKLGTSELPPLLLTAIRFAIVALLVTPLRPLPKGKLGGVIALSIVLGLGHFGVLFVGIKGLDTPTAAITIQLGVPFSAIAATLVYREKLRFLTILGMALSFSGVALLAGEPTHPDPFSLALVIFAAACWAGSNLILKKIGSVDGLALNGWMSLFTAPQVFLASLIFESGQKEALLNAGWAGWGAVGFTVLMASLVAYTLWYRLMTRYQVNRVVPFALLTPVIGVVAGVLILGDPLGWHKLLGGGLTILGVAIIQLRPFFRPRGPRSEDTPA